MSAVQALDEAPAGYVYDGRQLLGLIFDNNAGCTATDLDRRPLGRFKNWREAQTAILELHRQSGGEA